MRRAQAILLLCLFSFGLIGPVVRADASAQTPACCKRAGTHHCSLTRTTDTDGVSIAGTCPNYRIAQGVAPVAGSALVARPGCTADLAEGVAEATAPLVRRADPRGQVLRLRGPPFLSRS